MCKQSGLKMKDAVLTAWVHKNRPLQATRCLHSKENLMDRKSYMLMQII